MTINPRIIYLFFFFNDTATTEIYTLSLHDALPIWRICRSCLKHRRETGADARNAHRPPPDRKSTRLNSSHGYISYAVFCLKKKKKTKETTNTTTNTPDCLHFHNNIALTAPTDSYTN